MSITFAKTREKEQNFQVMLDRYDSIAEAITPYANVPAMQDLVKLKQTFQRRIEDFFRDDRKLNIAVVGRVKAGKSTFLNMLLFEGKDVLPRAFTPKTATLTKIEYAPQNALEVEYYSPEDWQSLMNLAKSDSSVEEAKAARELAADVRASGINPGEYTQRDKERIDFPSEDELMGKLNYYVGDNGTLTPLVKSVILYINRKELEGISIVDTPGLNDPVLSRTQQTRQFLELCDSIFFLSPASHFLNRGDVDLLRAQLPQKGIAGLTLICSRFDEGLVDANYDMDSLEETIADTKKRLRRHSVQTFSGKDTPVSDKAGKLMEACKNPLFLSSIFHNMAGRSTEEYTESERKAFDDLNEHDDLSEELIAQIGDISAIEKELKDTIAQKDEVLSQRAEGFVPAAENELNTFLENLRRMTLKHLNLLVSKDRENLETQRKEAQRKIHGIKAQVEEHFGEASVRMEQAKISILQDLRRNSREYSTISERTGTETKERVRKVSDSKWWNPFSWGSSHKEYIPYQVSYTYVDVSDALDNLRHYANDAAGSIEEGFLNAVNVKSLKTGLLKVVVNEFDASSESYDPAYFRLLTEQTLNRIEFPVMRISADSAMSKINAKFSGEIRDSSERNALKNELASAVADLFDHFSVQLEQAIRQFKGGMDKLKDEFGESLLKNINEEFASILQECETKEASIRKLQEFDGVLEQEILRYRPQRQEIPSAGAK